MFKKISSIFLAFALALSFVPAFAGAAPSGDTAALKAQIESATADTVINLDAAEYSFDATTLGITSTKNIKITLVGATNADGTPATKFTMTSDVTGAPRFVRADSGSIDISNVELVGVKGVGGGISAKNVTAINTVFTNNYTNDGTNGGGAIRATGGDLVIKDSTFTGNSVFLTSDGGAVSAESSGNITIDNSVFDSNERIGNNNQYGGAISVKNPGVAGSVISITNSAFTNNKNDATGNLTRGGAIHIYDQLGRLKSVLIDNVLFKNNTAVQNNGGAIAFMAIQGATTTTISNSTFMGNSAAKYGGAIYYENCATAGNNKIINSTFVENAAKYILGNAGKSVGAYASKVTIESSTLINNLPNTQGTGSVITIKNSILSDATASATGGSGTITYEGTNLMKLNSADPAVPASSVFTFFTAATLVRVNDYNYVAPIIKDGPAYEKVDAATVTRLLPRSQNDLVRKSPLSDIGAFELVIPDVTVTFEANGGTPVPASQTVQAGSTVTEPTTPPTKTGYTFAGWYDDDVFTAAWVFSTGVVDANMTLYAKWDVNKYTVSFDSQGGSDVASETIDYGEHAYVPVDEPVREGYTFAGWFKEAQTTTPCDFTNDVITGDVTCYAKWTINSYSVSFDSKGGSAVPAQNVDYKGHAIKPSDPVLAGFAFIGWCADTTATVPVDVTAAEVVSNTTYYAKWAPISTAHKVTFDSQGGSKVDTQNVADGESAIKPANPTKSGYTFLGWYSSAQNGTLWNFTTDKVVKDVTLYAHWKTNDVTPVTPGGNDKKIIPADGSAKTSDSSNLLALGAALALSALVVVAAVARRKKTTKA